MLSKIDQHIFEIIPEINQKLVIDLVNSIVVIHDNIEYQKKTQPFLLKILNTIFQKNNRQQLDINENIFQSIQSLTSIVCEIINNVQLGYQAIDCVYSRIKDIENNIRDLSDFSFETRKLFDNLNKRHHDLQNEIKRIDSEQMASRHISQAFDFWAAGNYDSLSLAGRLYCTLENLYYGDFGSYYNNPNYDNNNRDSSTKHNFLIQIKNKAIIQLNSDIQMKYDIHDKRPTIQRWYQYPDNSHIDIQSAIAYLSNSATKNDHPFIFTLSNFDNPPYTIPTFFEPKRICISMSEEVFSKNARKITEF
jgi:hypothetical protein